MAIKSKMKSAELASTAEGRQYHIGLAPGEVAPYIMMCGDPARVYKVAEYFDEKNPPVCNREYVTITGKYKGLPISVMATGMGPDNTEIAVIELSQIVANPTFIRVGTSGGLREGVLLNNQVISTGSVRLENTSTAFVFEGYPAVAHHEVVLALIESANRMRLQYHVGLTATGSGFYGLQGRKVPGFPIRDEEIPKKLARMNVCNFEMESSCLFTLSNMAGHRAGMVCLVIADRRENVWIEPADMAAGEKRVIEIALGAFGVLDEIDRAKGKTKFWSPSMGL
ncbi:MAG: Uridine phosphorylase [bacterium ADurb.Bin270]|nr:MAG: Uridine phosphorylase [bacterium ADurb.Bin270]